MKYAYILIATFTLCNNSLSNDNNPYKPLHDPVKEQVAVQKVEIERLQKRLDRSEEKAHYLNEKVFLNDIRLKTRACR